MPDKLEILKKHVDDQLAEIQLVKDRAEADKRELNQDERKEVDGRILEIDDLKEQYASEKRLRDAQAWVAGVDQPDNRQTIADPIPQNGNHPGNGLAIPPGETPRFPIENKGKLGWRSFGEFSQGVRNACINAGHIDQRLSDQIKNAPSTYGTEGTGADGGFLVPPDFRNEIMMKLQGEESLLARTDQLTTSSNSLTIPADETTPWQTSGGILAYWESEAGQITQSKPALIQNTIRLNKLSALVPVTEELLEDAPSLDAYLSRKAPEKMMFKLNLAIVQGTGVGQPSGIMSHASTVSVAKQGSQVADTIVGANIVDMWSRMYGPLRGQAIWLINQDVEPQLLKLSLPGIDNTGAAVTGWGTQLYVPPGGFNDSPYGSLLGRPIITTQACETVGDLGDILLWAPQSYLSVTKGGGVRADTSVHLFFDYDMVAFRFIFRVAGQPWWSSTISVRDGSNTLGCTVSLAERA